MDLPPIPILSDREVLSHLTTVVLNDGDASANPDSAQLAHPKMASLSPSYHSWAMCALCLLLTECVELVANQ